MKNIVLKITVCLTFFAAFFACQEDDKAFGDLTAPSNLAVEATIAGQSVEFPDGDGTGFVNFVATAENAISYKYIFSDGTSINSPSGILRKRFTLNGTNTYTVTVIASGRGGVASTITTEVTVFSVFDDPETKQLLTGGTTKTWYFAASEPGHLGVGQNNSDGSANFYPNYYSAAPWEKAGSPDSDCLYENELTFTLNNDMISYQLNNGGRTFVNAAYLGDFGTSGGSDLCMTYDSSGIKNVSLEPADSFVVQNNVPNQTTGTQMTFSDNGFMGYYIGQSTYEILSITENRMVVRAVMGNNPSLAWYHIFVSTRPVQGGTTPDVDYTNLVWQDEFDIPGAPDNSKWSYNIGNGNNGWGNNESQYYTDRPENVIVEDGLLKIRARRETFSGFNFTSSRLVTENKFEFTYGKVEVRAKLPTGGGTWPAIWMLGQNYATNPWPNCGEIDIMEHVGNQQNTIHGSLHYPGNFGGTANTASTTISNVSSEFHVYKVIWSPDSIKFYVDDQPAFHTYTNSASSPFNLDFFLILNVAMGGNFGGAIDPAFTQSTMEVDYVRVYQ
ncbi:family 16 glycosylhydrolase [Flavobacterium sp. NST-5]|uniref:Family 16 glycosylhydrolase n=1 Tax=Flavobacterium ichthyis TaxID=2698827 RepID=A0ABW9Z5H6_9FLAO|nr:family 16 glycosylhydrolase [Flavobacterium ichthyis]NBL64101.1 family 16 glycosylhydrolase [Flavobacterium ichthyis]